MLRTVRMICGCAGLSSTLRRSLAIRTSTLRSHSCVATPASNPSTRSSESPMPVKIMMPMLFACGVAAPRRCAINSMRTKGSGTGMDRKRQCDGLDRSASNRLDCELISRTPSDIDAEFLELGIRGDRSANQLCYGTKPVWPPRRTCVSALCERHFWTEIWTAERGLLKVRISL
jgi:hypothetical protein